jgi:polygalacturonase
MDACPNAHVEGVTIRDIPRGWTSRYNECDHLLIQGVKIFSFKVNGDGIDPNGCQDVTIENCLVSTGDDAVVIKSTEGSQRNVSGITVRGCVLETYPKTTAGEGGDALKIGTETYCPDMSGILFENCDIVRAHGGMAFSINHRNQARIHDVQFTDIRIEGDVENENFGIVMLDSGPGTVSDVTLRNVAWTVRNDILLKGQGISGVRFENCTVAGSPLEDVKVVDGAQAPTISP